MNEDLKIQFPPSQIDFNSPQLPLQKPFPVWSGWDVLLLFLFTGFAALFVGAFGGAASHLLQVRFPSTQFLRHPAIEGMLLLSFQALLDIFILCFIYFTITLKYDSPFWSSIKWIGGANHSWVVYLPVGVLLAFVVLWISTLFPSTKSAPIEQLLKDPISASLFAVLGVFLAPFVEEVIFRGFIYPVVERKLGKIFAVVSTAFLFAAVHVNQLWGSWTGIFLILVVGITLSTVRAKTDSLVPSFVIHISYNSTICLLFLAGSLIKGFPTY
jgi:membrane protease YdiL (CAAX protease family)